MNCPACKVSGMKIVELEENLSAKACKKCGGYWIPYSNYQKWLDRYGDTLPEKSAADPDLPVEDSQEAKLCPECGRILRKYKIGYDIKFHLEHCGNCHGIWFDKNEWEVLKSRNLHDQLHEFFTAAWQKKIRGEEFREKLEKIYSDKFGREDYEKIKDIKEWIDSHEQRSIILAFLSEKDPYEQ